MKFILFVLASYFGWCCGKKIYHYWVSKGYWKIVSVIGAICFGFLIASFSFAFSVLIFETTWTAVVFIIACLITWIGFNDPSLLRFSATGRLWTKKQLGVSLSILAFVLAMFGMDTSTEAVDSSNTPLPVVAQNTEKPIDDDLNQDNPFNDENASTTVEANQVVSTTSQEPNLENNLVNEPEPVVEPEEEEVTVFREEDNNSCGGLPSRCTEMRDCKQAYQALECGNYKLDRDDDGIPCESICG